MIGSRRHAMVVASVSIALCVLLGCSRPQPAAELRHANELVGLGKFAEAIGVLGRAERREVDSEHKALLWLTIGELYADGLQNDEQALVALTKAIDCSPLGEGGRAARERRASLEEEAGAVEAFITDMASLVKYYPTHPQAPWYCLRLSEGFLMAERFEEARGEMAKLLTEKNLPDALTERVLFDVGESYFLQARANEAKNYYNALIQQFPHSSLVAEAKLKLASSVEELGYLGTAYRLATEAGHDYPNQAAIAVRLKSLAARGTQQAPTSLTGED